MGQRYFVLCLALLTRVGESLGRIPVTSIIHSSLGFLGLNPHVSAQPGFSSLQDLPHLFQSLISGRVGNSDPPLPMAVCLHLAIVFFTPSSVHIAPFSLQLAPALSTFHSLSRSESQLLLPPGLSSLDYTFFLCHFIKDSRAYCYTILLPIRLIIL